jgi:hypothetical protein
MRTIIKGWWCSAISVSPATMRIIISTTLNFQIKIQMKNYFKKIGIACAMLLAFSSCEDDNHTFGDINAPNGLQVTATVVGEDNDHPNGDGSGFVDFVATANNAISYKYIFGDNTTTNSPSGIIRHRFSQPGLNTYSVTVLASGTAGVISSITFDITVQSDFSDPAAVQFLTGGGSKTWYWAAAEPGHLGVGQNDSDITKNYYGNYYQAAPFEKAGSPDSSCLYENELTFSLVGGELKFELDNGGQTFFNTAFLGVGGGAGSSDLCLDYNSSGQKNVTLSPAGSLVDPSRTTGTLMTFSDGGFMGYYIGQSSYEIMSITDNRMVVRAIMGGNPALAWYHTFSSSPPVQPGNGFTNLVFEENFDVDGAPNPANWSYNIGAGGWGNEEAQYYTDSAENVKVENGILKITAKAQNLNGSNYTSARLVTENKYEFKYGKVEVRAKLPTGGGTWPAIWMLGENYATNPWPACGEIDIMEHKGNDQNKIFATLHLPGFSGGNGISGNKVIANASTEFHIYSAEWSATSIKFFVDGELFHSYANSAATPFNANFFIILNVAMGGTFGGAIDSGFVQSTMEVDYVKVYQ